MFPTRHDSNIEVLQARGTQYFFTSPRLSIYAPTKAGSSSLRLYMEENGLESTAYTKAPYGAPSGVLWKDSDYRVAVVRDPIQRWQSGIREMLKRHISNESPADGNLQPTEDFWRAHIHPYCKQLAMVKEDYYIIPVEILSDYIHIQRNKTKDDDRWMEKIRKMRDPFVAMLYEKDKEWLEEERHWYKHIRATKPEMSVAQFNSLMTIVKMDNEKHAPHTV